MKWRRARPLAEALSLEFFDPPTPCRVFVLPPPFVSLINFLSLLLTSGKKNAQGAGTWILVDAPRARNRLRTPERKMNGTARRPGETAVKFVRQVPLALHRRHKLKNKINEYG